MSAQGMLDRRAVRSTPFVPARRPATDTPIRKSSPRHSASAIVNAAAKKAVPGEAAKPARGGTRSAKAAVSARSTRAHAAPTLPTPAKAASDAYARREERLRRVAGGWRAVAPGATGRAQFILLVMALLTTGMVLTLWLSTAAAADSYRLQDARTAARDLTEQAERLHREVASMDSAPALAQRAKDLGLVPVNDPARLVVGPDGTVTLVGRPLPATPPPPVEPPRPPSSAQQPAPARPGPGAAAPAQSDTAAQSDPAAHPDAAAHGAQPGGAGG